METRLYIPHAVVNIALLMFLDVVRMTDLEPQGHLGGAPGIKTSCLSRGWSMERAGS